MFLQHVFNQRRRYFLSGRRDDQLLLATDDLQKAIVIHFTEVASQQPAVRKYSRSLLRSFVVTAEHHFAAHQNLFVCPDSNFTARHRWPDSAELVMVGTIERDADVFSQTV